MHTSLGTAGLSLLLFFGINLWGLTLDLTSTSQRTVDFTTKKSGLSADGGVWGNTNLFQSETSLDWGGENFTRWNLNIYYPDLKEYERENGRLNVTDVT